MSRLPCVDCWYILFRPTGRWPRPQALMFFTSETRSWCIGCQRSRRSAAPRAPGKTMKRSYERFRLQRRVHRCAGKETRSSREVAPPCPEIPETASDGFPQSRLNMVMPRTRPATCGSTPERIQKSVLFSAILATATSAAFSLALHRDCLSGMPSIKAPQPALSQPCAEKRAWLSGIGACRRATQRKG